MFEETPVQRKELMSLFECFRITGENVHYGTPTNPKLPSHIPGGSSSGSAVAVAADLVDFSLGMDLNLNCSY